MLLLVPGGQDKVVWLFVHDHEYHYVIIHQDMELVPMVEGEELSRLPTPQSFCCCQTVWCSPVYTMWLVHWVCHLCGMMHLCNCMLPTVTDGASFMLFMCSGVWGKAYVKHTEILQNVTYSSAIGCKQAQPWHWWCGLDGTDGSLLDYFTALTNAKLFVVTRNGVNSLKMCISLMLLIRCCLVFTGNDGGQRLQGIAPKAPWGPTVRRALCLHVIDCLTH